MMMDPARNTLPHEFVDTKNCFCRVQHSEESNPRQSTAETMPVQTSDWILATTTSSQVSAANSIENQLREVPSFGRNKKISKDLFTEPRIMLPATYQLTGYDVLCGRHKLAFNHKGNRRFRVLVSTFLGRYFDQSSRTERAILVLDIINAIQQAGGHFLAETQNGQWIEISEKRKRNKVGHAIRDAAAAARTTDNPTKASTTAKEKKVAQKTATGSETKLNDDIKPFDVNKCDSSDLPIDLEEIFRTH